MRASLEVADIFRAAGPAYRATHAGHLSLQHLKVMSAIEHCRTQSGGLGCRFLLDRILACFMKNSGLWAK